MNVKCQVYGGGVFSKFMLVVQNILEKKITNIDNIFIENLDKRIDLNINPFDYIFNQKNNLNFTHKIKCKSIPCYKCNFTNEEIEKLNTIISCFKIKDNILKTVNDFVNKNNIGENTLGIHIRLTDMNEIHGNDYGIKNFNDYIKTIDSFLKNNNVNNIYVASDNNESIDKLKSIYGDAIIYNNSLFRANNENDDVNFQLKNFSEEKLWVDTFVEMLTLSKCEYLICRVSNLANAAILYGFFKKIWLI